MSAKQHSGIYWGQDSFSIVETDKGALGKFQHIPFNTPIDTDQSQDIPDGLRYTALLQKATRSLGITSKFVNLSLPTEDLIFRSFVIPFMQPNEVKNVVDFEATKYIPIKLEDLVYTFHAIPFTENAQKNLRILFVAIRRDLLQRYIGILEHSGLKVGHIEPAAVSLVRVLQKQRHIPSKGSLALIALEQDAGKIIIVEDGIVQYIRRLQMPDLNGAPDIVQAHLFNDIRVSFNFYNRQNPKGTIDKIISISTIDLPALQTKLPEEFGKPAQILKAADLFGNNQTETLDLLNAFGVALHEKESSSKYFDLSDKAVHEEETGTGLAGLIHKYQTLAGSILFFLVAVVLSSFLSSRMAFSHRNKLAQLKSQLGTFEKMSLTDIQALKKKAEQKLNAYQDVQTESNIWQFLYTIPDVLPPGAWLENIQAVYQLQPVTLSQGKREIATVSLNLSGYVYLPDANEQFRLVNNLVAYFKKNEEFAGLFPEITLENSQQTTFNDFTVTSFKILCVNKSRQ